MDASRLLDLLIDLEEEIADGYEDSLAGLIRVYTQARDNPTQDFSEAIGAARDQFLTVVSESRTNDYPPSRVSMLEQLGARSLFGLAVRSRIETALQQGHSGPAAVVKQLEVLRAELSKFKSAAVSARKGMASMGVETQERDPEDCEVGIIIPTRLTGTHLGPLTDELAKWNRILKAFAEAAGDEEREVSVSALASGSYEIYVVAACTTAALLATAIERIAGIYKSILEIQLLRSQLAAKKVPSLEPEKIKEHEKSLLKEGLDELVRDLLKQTQAKLEPGRKNEIKIQLTMSVTQMASFIDSGGSVEVSPPAEEPVDEAEEDEDSADETAAPDPKALAERQRLEKARLVELERNAQIRRGGASLTSLPPREERILQLPPGEEAADGDGKKKGTKSH